MKVLVTGGAGFIGSHLAEFHLSKGDEVYIIDNLTTGRLENIKHLLTNSKCHFINTDILNCNNLAEIVSTVERIYHLAATLGMFNVLANPVLTIENNIKTAEVILTAVKNLTKKPLIILASSSEVYGYQLGPLPEDRPLMLESTAKNHATYPISKICNESMGLAFYHENKVPVIIARIFNTIGARQSDRYGMVVPRFIKQAINNEPITIFDNGEQKRSFCDVYDTVNLLDLLASNKDAVGEIFNVGNNQLVTINQLASMIKASANSTSEIIYVPYEKVYQGGYIDIKERCIDTTKLLAHTNYHYKKSLAQTLNHLIQLQQHEKA